MAKLTSGYFPVYKIEFKIGTKGIASTEAELVSVKEMESFSLSIEGGTESWTTMDQEGWASNLMTAKKLTISLKGKRHIGDPGNDYVAAVAYKDGLDCTTKASVVFPNGDKLDFNCVLDIKTLGGDSTNVAPLEFDMIGDGKPTFTSGTTSIGE